ncbi:MAG: hypothetical protein AAF591_22850 [Verrucomicrobiota bacterium]
MKTRIGESIIQRSVFRWAVVFLLLAGFAGVVMACQVPVFRYALERWQADGYELAVVVGPEGLVGDEKAVMESLDEMLKSGDAHVNLRLRVEGADADGESVGEANAEAKREGGETDWSAVTPRLELYFPSKLRRFYKEPIWRGAVTTENVGKVLQSPVREELVKRILAGESAVWLMVETGNQKKDDAAAAEMEKLMGVAAGRLEIPEGVIGANDAPAGQFLSPMEAENVLQSEIPLKVDFSLVRVSREDAAEAVLLSMLLSVEDDLGEFADKPMVYPVFGRGRVLEPLIGAGITEDNVMFASSYLCGACSCQVKDENPGIDLLVAANWDAAVDGSSVIAEKVLPPLEGFGALMASATVADETPVTPEDVELQDDVAEKRDVEDAVAAKEEKSENEVEKAEKDGLSPLLVMGVAVLGVFVGIIVATLKMRRGDG